MGGVKERVGIAFGCFIPLHSGHMAMIDRALDENKKVILGVTGHDCDRGRDFIPFLRRVRLMERVYGHDPRIILSEIDDREIGLTGTFSREAWETWCRRLFAHTGCCPADPGIEYTWYTGEQAYAEKLKEIYPHHGMAVLDRTKNPLSGTKVREDWRRYGAHIHPAFVEYLGNYRHEGLKQY